MPIPAGPISYTVRADFSGTSYGGTPTWTDITQRVAAGSGFPAVNISRWRQDQVSDLTPTQVGLSLQNNDGRFTPGLASSPYYPNVRRRTRLQVGGTVAGVPVYLADVFADSWEVSRDGSAVWLSNFSGTDVLGRMGADTPLRPAAVEEAMLLSPYALYPLTDPTGAAATGDLVAGLLATITASKYGTGTFTFGYTPAPFGMSGALVLTSPDAGSASTTQRGYTLLVPNNFANTVISSFAVSVWFQPSTTPPATSPAYLFNSPLVVASVDTSGHVTAGMPGFTSAFTSKNYCDGAWHHLVIAVDGSHGTVTTYLDNVPQTASGSTFTFNPSGPPITVGGKTATSGLFSGALSLLSFHPGLTAGSVLNLYNAGANGFAPVGGFGAETADMRIARLLRYRTNFGSSLDLGDMVMGPATTDGMTLQAALFEAAQADGGVVFADGQGQIVFRARIVNYDPAAQLTLDASQKHVSFPTSLRDDIQFMLNDVTVTRPNGAAQRVVDNTSVTKDGEAASSLTLNVATDWEALQLAGWAVAQGRQEWVGVPSLTVDLMHAGTAVALAICQLQPLDMITLTNLPSPLPSSLNLQVQGVSLSLATDAQTATLFCSPVAPAVWRLDATPSVYNQLDTGLVIAA